MVVPFDFAGDDLVGGAQAGVSGGSQAEKSWFIRARSPTMIGSCARITG
jgi:hypothetical protein